MKNRVVPVLITLVLIIIVGAATVVSLISAYRKGSTEFVDFERTYDSAAGIWRVPSRCHWPWGTPWGRMLLLSRCFVRLMPKCTRIRVRWNAVPSNYENKTMYDCSPSVWNMLLKNQAIVSWALPKGTVSNEFSICRFDYFSRFSTFPCFLHTLGLYFCIQCSDGRAPHIPVIFR